MPQQNNRSWELMQILKTATDISLDHDLSFLVASSKDELFEYLIQETQDEDYHVRDALDLIVQWLKTKGVTDKDQQFYAIKNVCAALYFERNSQRLTIEDKNNIEQELRSLYVSMNAPHSLLGKERQKFLSAISIGGNAAGQYSANILYRMLTWAGLWAAPIVLIYASKTLAGEEMTPEDWRASLNYGLITLSIGGVGMGLAHNLHTNRL